MSEVPFLELCTVMHSFTLTLNPLLNLESKFKQSAPAQSVVRRGCSDTLFWSGEQTGPTIASATYPSY